MMEIGWSLREVSGDSMVDMKIIEIDKKEVLWSVERRRLLT